tara:strand:- start:84 stop:3977 length:3894 start_codon:yes stop_codon:yes gene_type:complete
MAFEPLNDAEENNEASWYEAAGAGLVSGVLKVPEGVVSLAAELIDLGADTKTAIEVEKFFDKLNPFEEVAQQHAAGKITEALVSIGVPGAAGFKTATKLADKALKAKKAGQYATLGAPNVVKGLTQANRLNKRAGVKRFAAGVMGGAAGETMVADVEEIGTFGDMFQSAPTGLERDDDLGPRHDAARKLMNRIKFGSESILLTPFVYGVGTGAKALAKRGKDLAYSNSRFERIVDKIGGAFRPRQNLPEDLFLSETYKEALKASDLNRANEVVKNITREVDKMFPSIQTMYDKSTRQEKTKFLKNLNEVLFEGNMRKPIDPKRGTELFKNIKAKKLTEGQEANLIRGINQSRSEFARLIDLIDDVKVQDDLRGIMKDRIQGLVGNTYKIFEDKSLLGYRAYQPTDEAYSNAINLFRRYIAKNNKGVPFRWNSDQYYQEAKMHVDDILEQVNKMKKPKTLPDFQYQNLTTGGQSTKSFVQLVDKGSLGKIQIGKGSKVFRELFGELQDPRYSIFNAMTNLSSIARTKGYLGEIVAKNDAAIKAGQRGFFWGSEAEAKAATNRVADVVPLNPIMSRMTKEGNLTNPLADMWTTKEIAAGIENMNNMQTGFTAFVRGREGASTAENVASWMYRSLLLLPKGLSQIAKTVLSIPTHIRNFLSAGAFAGANGILFENPKVVAQAFRDGINISGLLNVGIKDPAFEKLYRELVELGVVNQQVQIGDLKNLLKDIKFGEQVSNTDSILRPMLSKLRKVGQFFQGKYVAEDDTWKITNYFVEMARRKKAYANAGIKMSDDALKQEAANIVKNTVPNYAYVGDVVKTARLLPIGNFMSFPSEMIRTTTNIAELGLKEMRHSKPTRGSNVLPMVYEIGKGLVKNDNPMYGIGFRRISGMATTLTVVPTVAVEGAKALYDVTEDELQALRRFVPEWSKNSTIIPIRTEDGELKYMDFSHSNAYDVIGRPFRTLMNNIQEGEQNGEQLLDSFVSGVNEAGAEIMNPFISESIWTEAVTDLTVRGGRTAEGRLLYTDETSAGDKAAIRFRHLGNALAPSYKQFQRLYQAATKTPTKRGDLLEVDDEIAGFMGFRPIKVDPLDSMGFKISEFQEGMRNARREFTGGIFGLLAGGRKSPTDVINRYIAANAARFGVQQEMFRNIEAAGILGTESSTLRREFKDRQVSPRTYNKLEEGTFEPYYPSIDIQKRFKEIAEELGEENPFLAVKDILRAIYNQFREMDLRDEFDIDVSEYVSEDEGLADIQTPPLGKTPMPVINNRQLLQKKDPITNLTRTEQALLSPSEKIIAGRT